jgi:hypothetical protein
VSVTHAVSNLLSMELARQSMTGQLLPRYLAYAGWGLFGGFAVEGLDFTTAIKKTGDWPWRSEGEPGPLPLAVSVVIRLLIGAGLAAAAVGTHQVSGPLGAIAIGVGAPYLVGQMARQVPLKRQAPRKTPQARARPEDAIDGR